MRRDLEAEPTSAVDSLLAATLSEQATPGAAIEIDAVRVRARSGDASASGDLPARANLPEAEHLGGFIDSERVPQIAAHAASYIDVIQYDKAPLKSAVARTRTGRHSPVRAVTGRYSMPSTV